MNIQEQQRELSGLQHKFLERSEAIKSLALPERQAFMAPDGEGGKMKAAIDAKFAELQSDSELIRYQEKTRAQLKADMEPQRLGLFGGGGSAIQDTRSLGQRFVESNIYKERSGDLKMKPLEAKFDGVNLQEWQGAALDSSIKATLTTTTGYAPFIPRTGRVVPIGQIQPVISDLIPHTSTEVPGGKYMEETTYLNNAGIVPEGTTKPEAGLGFTERTFGMQKVAVSIPVTDEQLSDVPQIRGIIDNRLALMLRQKDDGYLLNNTTAGGGAYDGFLQKTGVQAVPMGVNPLPTAVLNAMTQIEFQPGFASVTALIMNPLDWAGYVTYQISTGAYLVGSPSDAAITTMWGMPIIRTNRMPQGTALLGDFRTYAEIIDREDITLRVGYINTDFLDNIQRILAEMRNTLNIYRANAFSKITGVAF